jgi:hypothetical protein
MFERRLGPRIEVHGTATVELDGFRGQLTLLNVSPGGFGIATTALVSGNCPLEFTFSGSDGRWTMTFAARLAYIRVDLTSSDNRDVYLAGFTFVDVHDPDVASRVEELMEKVALAARVGEPTPARLD